MDEWRTEITDIQDGLLVTRGRSQVEMISTFAFEDVVFLLLQGRVPTLTERDLLRAVLVSHMSHGITGQSTLAVRMAADCRASFFDALVAGFATGSGRYHQGGLEATMLELIGLAKLDQSQREDELRKRISAGGTVFGFGHRYHKSGDPRARALLEQADMAGFNGSNIEAARDAEKVLLRMKGIRMNIEAAGGAILLDLGFAPEIAHLFIILGRSTMFAAAYQERLREGKGPFPRVKVFDEGKSL